MGFIHIEGVLSRGSHGEATPDCAGDFGGNGKFATVTDLCRITWAGRSLKAKPLIKTEPVGKEAIRVEIETSSDQLRQLAVNAGAITEVEARTLEREIVQLANVIRDIARSDVQPGELRMVKE
jgi:hypothetical protein